MTFSSCLIAVMHRQHDFDSLYPQELRRLGSHEDDQSACSQTAAASPSQSSVNTTCVTGRLAEIQFIMSPEMSTESLKWRPNWWGRASTISLFIWFLYWFKNEPHSVTGQILLWVPLAVIHLLAMQEDATDGFTLRPWDCSG